MIFNIIVLLLANTILPNLPIPPHLAAPLPFLHLILKDPTVFEDMNLNRLHTPEEFKKAFRDSLKSLHPDRGGEQEAFSRVKNLKKIMEQEVNYYDCLNITDSDLQYNIPFKEVVSVKETTYFVEAGIYYFIILLYSLAFTAEDDLRPARKVLLPLIAIFAMYEAYIHINPSTITVIDLISNKIPIFIQKTILKTILSTLVAIIRTKYSRKVTLEKKSLSELQKDHTPEEYKEILQTLSGIYKEKLAIKSKQDNSWGSRIKGWISKGFTILVIISIAKGFFSTGEAEQTQDF